ncbi:hypothetical protein D3C72_1890760 [compost metagenome]
MPMILSRGRSIGRTALIESFPYSDKGALDGSSSQRLRQAGTEPTEIIRRTLDVWIASVALE